MIPPYWLILTGFRNAQYRSVTLRKSIIWNLAPEEKITLFPPWYFVPATDVIPFWRGHFYTTLLSVLVIRLIWFPSVKINFWSISPSIHTIFHLVIQPNPVSAMGESPITSMFAEIHHKRVFFKTMNWCLRGYCTPDQFFDCLCIFLKNYNTLATSKVCFL